MSAHLLIHDGSPIVGVPAYLWARVSNTGNVAATGWRIDFSWANPSAAVQVGVATFIGSAYADLEPGETQEVLCLVTWMPVLVNGGPECVPCVVHGPGDTSAIPDPLPAGFNFDPPSHDQIAQLNLSVLEAAMLHMPQTMFVIGMGRAARCHDWHEQHGDKQLKVHVERGARVPVFVTLHASELPHGTYELVRVAEHDAAGQLQGGVSYLVANTHASHNEELAS
jgi:hypothetical protein